MVTQKEYNGWTNYETWLMALWIGNEECLQDTANEMAEQSRHEDTYILADQLKCWIESFEEIEEIQNKGGFVSDLLGAAMSEIDWFEIAEHYREDLDPEEEEDKEEDVS